MPEKENYIGPWTHTDACKGDRCKRILVPFSQEEMSRIEWIDTLYPQLQAIDGLARKTRMPSGYNLKNRQRSLAVMSAQLNIYKDRLADNSLKSHLLTLTAIVEALEFLTETEK